MSRVWCLCALLLVSSCAVSADKHIQSFIPEAEKVGEGRLSFLLWSIYDAALYAPKGEWHPESPFALKLTYLRDISGKDIADRSIEEIRDQGFTDELKLADWHAQLLKILPNVKKQSSLTGVSTDGAHTIFHSGDQLLGKIMDAEFTQYFFNIWLGENSSEPELRQQLLGLK